MPVWHKAMQEARDSGDVVFVGVVQEQHPNRCRLFAQWQQFDWPILHDPVNLLSLRVVPVFTAIDEHGIVRDTSPDLESIEDRFLSQTFPPPKEPIATVAATKPNIALLRTNAAENSAYDDWKKLGDALVLWSDSNSVNEAIHAYEQARGQRPNSAEIHFRLGVAYRMRYDSEHEPAGTSGSKRLPNSSSPLPTGTLPSVGASSDFQVAIDYWGQALAIDPNHYIYRRRIQQYGPRLSKPYPFYDWLARARADVVASGRVPVSLSVEPSGAEIARPIRRFVSESGSEKSPDPDGKIHRDLRDLIGSNVVVVPGKARAGQTVRVHLAMEPAPGAHWNNEAEPLVVWIDLPGGWESERSLLKSDLPSAAETNERRLLEFELKIPEDAQGPQIVNAYALYYVCEEQGGTCLYLRKDLPILVRIAKEGK